MERERAFPNKYFKKEEQCRRLGQQGALVLQKSSSLAIRKMCTEQSSQGLEPGAGVSLVVLGINELGRPQDTLGLGWWQLLSVTLDKS